MSGIWSLNNRELSYVIIYTALIFQLLAPLQTQAAITFRAAASNSVGSGSLAISVPPGTLTDDVMIASVTFRPCSNSSGNACSTTLTAPSGWTLVRNVNNTTGGGTGGYGSRLFIYRRVATSSEPSSYTWTFGGTPSQSGTAGGILSFSGVDTSNPIVVENGQTTAGPSNHSAPSLNTGTIANTMLVSSHAVNSSGTWTKPASMTERVDRSSLTPNNNLGISLEINTEAYATAGATGTRTASLSSPPTGDTGSTHMLALRPSAGGAGTNAANFNCVESGASASIGTLYTKLSGVPFSFDVAALKADGSVETGYVISTSKNVTVELVDGSGSTACSSRSPVNPAISQTLTFAAADSGRKAAASITVSNAYPNLRCRVTDANQSPSVIGCSADNFAVRPTGFSVAASANADATGTSTSATPIIKAGASFTLSAASGTAGYNYAPQLDISKISAHSGASQTGTLTGSYTAADASTGTATGAIFTYSEVGYFKFAANGVYDDTFTAVDSAASDCTNDFSNSLVGGKYGCKFGNTTTTAYFGRFIPDHFSLTQGTATPACSPSFTYFGQDGFSTLFTLTAQNSSNNTTKNYQGGFARLGLTAWGGFNFSSASLPAGSLLSASATAPVGTWNQGVADVIAKHQVSRPTALTGETSVVVQTAPVDLDGVTMPATAVTAGTPLRYGRLVLQNAHGSELLELPVSLTAQYWNGSAFVLNAEDSCTTVSAPTSGSGLTFYPEVATGTQGNHLSAAETTATVSATNKLVAGDAQLKFFAPGARNDGYLDVSILAPDWLKFDWNAANPGDESPSGRVTFGIYKGSDSQIYLREVY